MYLQKTHLPHHRSIGQLERHMRYKAGSRRWYKKMANRIMRRWAKKDPENAPVKTPYDFSA